MANPSIEFIDVSKRYDNGTEGLKHISLVIQPGEFVVIVGLSGAGKSTLMRAVNRLHEISSGEVLIGGRSITKAKGKSLRQLRRQIGMIFQSFNLVGRRSVLQNVLAGRVGYYGPLRQLSGLFSNDDKLAAYRALETVGLAGKVYARADELSGGQMQRVAIARALTQQPQVILADEPVASLDPQTTEQIMDDLQRINQQLGITVLVNLHNVELAKTYGTRIIGINAGEKVYDGPADATKAADFARIYQQKEAVL